MNFKVIETSQAPAPVGPYSQAILADVPASKGILFCSGQVALDVGTGKLVGETAAEQAVKVMENVRAVIEAGGLKLSNIAKTTIFLTDMNDFAAVNEVYEKALEGHKPARSTIAVSALPKGAKVEIECLAFA